MTRESNATSSVVVAFLVVLAATGGFVAATGGVAADHGSPGNYTVHLPEQSDHYPGNQNGASASIWHLASMTDGFEDTSSKQGFEKASFLTIGSEEIDFSNCGTSNTAAFGIDRGNDDSGTTTDQDLLRHREDSQFNPNGIIVDFFDEGDFAGDTVHINATDQIVAVQNDCYTMPSEPGWYQIFGSLNGTGYNGNEFELQLTSHYFYVCDCASEQEARQQLGPPPSEQSGSQSTPTSTPEPQSTATPTPEPQSTPTPTPAQGGSTPTATPASSGGGGSNGGGSDDGAGGSGSTGQTATAQSQQTQTAGQQQQGQQGQQQQGQQATTTAAAEGAAPVTPTIAEGPGFGAGLALVALAGAALVALRRP